MADIRCEIYRKGGTWRIFLILPQWILDDIERDASGLITFIQADKTETNYAVSPDETTLSLILTSVSHVARIAEHEKKFNNLTFQDDAS